MQKMGEEFELNFSKEEVGSKIPVLVSPLLLRSFNLGQIDIAFLSKNKSEFILEVYELKTSKLPSLSQLRRLKKTCNYLAQILEIEISFRVRLCQKPKYSLFY
jgi:hypothetical protein